VFLSVGTSSVVYPAAAFLDRARSRGAFTVEINTEPTPATGVVDLVLTGPAGEILSRVDQRLEPIRSM
jgi:NAD-dependent deacetylase